MVSKRDNYKSEGEVLLKTLVKKLPITVFGGKVRQDKSDEDVFVADEWMGGDYYSSVQKTTSTKKLKLYY